MDWDDFGYEEEHAPDAYVQSAGDELRQFFEEHDDDVFFANQLAVRSEKRFFHWVTHRAISELVQEGLVLTEARKLASGSEIKLLWHRRHRYYRRDAKSVIELVDEYGSPNMCASIGMHGEWMVLEGFARKEFLMRGRGVREFDGKSWTESQHNLDFVFEREGRAYGIEVKNTLSYMDQNELRIKLRLCAHLGLTPVFAVRMLPKSWIAEIVDAGGYAMILGYQLYPWTHGELARRVAKRLGLPVDAPKALADGTMDKFLRWHRKNL
jgi:hypothetical protein